MCIAVDKLMASPSRHESVGEGISVAYQTLLADLKQRFPEFSEDSVKSLINQLTQNSEKQEAVQMIWRYDGDTQKVVEELSRSSDKILYGQDQRNVSRPLLQPGNYSLEPLNMLDQRNYNLFNNPLNLKDENHGFYYRDVNVNDNSRVANMNFQGSEQVRFNTPEVVRYNFQGHPVDMPLPNMPPMSSEQLRQRNAVGGQMSQASLLSTENQLELPRTEGGHVSPSRGVTGSRTITSTEPTSFSHSPYRQQPMSLSMSQFGSSLHQQVGHTSPVDNFHGTNLISNLVQNFPQGNNPYGHFGASLSPTNSQQAYMTHGPTSPPSPYFGTSLAPGTSQQTPVMNRPTSPRPTNVTPNTYQQNLLTHRPTSPRPVIDRQLQNHTLENTPYRQFGMAVSPGPSGPGMMIHPNPPSNFERRKTSQPNLEDGGSRHQLQPPMSMSLPSRDAVYFHGDASSLERQRKASLTEHLQQQKTSLDLLQQKILTLRNDIQRIRNQIQQEEDEINVINKVTKNPTEMDITRLRQEIQILQKETLMMSNEVDRIGDMESPTTDPIIEPPLIPPRPAPHPTAEDFVFIPRPHPGSGSGSRFPHPRHSLHQPRTPGPPYPPPHSYGNRPQYTPPTPTSPQRHPFVQPITPPTNTQTGAQAQPGSTPLGSEEPSSEHGPSFQSTQMEENPTHSSFDDNEEPWRCSECTFENNGLLTRCEICDNPRR